MLFALSAGLAALVAAPAPAGTRYDNAGYGLAFALPAGADVCSSPPPAADHGLLFRPAGVHSPPCDDDIESGARYINVDARFDADGAAPVRDFVRVECPQLAYDSQGRVTPIPPPILPHGAHSGGLAWSACRIDGADGAILEVLFGRRAASRTASPVAYRITLKTTPQAYALDHAGFVRWLATVRLRPPL